mgnify:CR=1 FL=1
MRGGNVEKFSDCWTYPKQKIDELLQKVVPIIRKINGKELDGDVTLTANDVGAVPDTGGTIDGSLHIDNIDEGTGTAWSELTLGNNKATGTEGNSAGFIRMYGNTQYKGDIYFKEGTPTGNHNIFLPDITGTLIPDMSNLGFRFVNSSNPADYEGEPTTGLYRILYGNPDSTLTISFEISWLKLQLRVPDQHKIQYRTFFGQTPTTGWKTVSVTT